MSTLAINAELRGYLDNLKGSKFEKCIPYMYTDTTGNVTIGVGHNLTAHGKLQLLSGFVVKRPGRKAVVGGDQGIAIAQGRIGCPASPVEKKNDYDFLRKHRGLGKYAPEQLAAYTTVEMDAIHIKQLFERDLQQAIATSRNTFGAAFDNYPVSCQAALIDIAFNCGGFSTFSTLEKALKGEGEFFRKPWPERWKVAAMHSKRGKVSPDRNTQIAQWFMAGASPATIGSHS